MTEAKMQKLRDILTELVVEDVIGTEIVPVNCNTAVDYDELYHDVSVLQKAKVQSKRWQHENPIMTVFALRFAPIVQYILFKFLEEDEEE